MNNQIATDETAMHSAIETMAAMQDRLNSTIDADWRDRGHAYTRAVWVECSELLDHYGWKWWKRQMPDLEQVKLEIVDIWHFGLSHLIRGDETLDKAWTKSFAIELEWGMNDSFVDAVEQLALVCLVEKRFSVNAFARVMRTLPMTFDELYQMYVAKNVLNDFRQENGYKTGEYIKVWHDGREDNAHLMDILPTITGPADALPNQLRSALSERYADEVRRRADELQAAKAIT